MQIRSDVVLRSSDRALEKRFDWAKRQALDWVTLGAPVGGYYEAALPGRAAFCMRDVSHQCTGAEVLGLGALNLNMFAKFAAAIHERLDYCSYWEIDRWDRPCPVDYKDEGDFWYNLPANFDMLHACWRMYLWTGRREYLDGAAFDRFYQLTMEQYIHRWDRDGDGLPDRVPSDGRRGLVSYDESEDACHELKVGADLVGSMARAHLSFAEMSRALGRDEFATIYGARGKALLKKLNEEWYDESRGGYARGLRMDDALWFSPEQFGGSFLLYWDLVPDTSRAARIARHVADKARGGMQVEGASHVPELLWRYGMDAEALAAFRAATAPEVSRREYPELSYCMAGAAATGLMGVCPDARTNLLVTRAGLADVKWAELEHVPTLGGLITIRHDGDGRSELSRERGERITWRAAFDGARTIRVNGEAVRAGQSADAFTGRTQSYVDVPLGAGQSAIVEAQ